MDSCRLPSPLNVNGNMALNWKIFRQQYEIYIKASEKSTKAKEIRAAILLNLLGEDGLAMYNSFTIADEKDVEEILKAFEEFCSPKKNVVFERFKFNKREQQAAEPFDTFLSDMQKLVRTCEYGNQEDSILRDRIVLGIFDKSFQEKLLGIEKLDAKKAIDMCRAAELTRTQAREMQSHRSIDVVNQHGPSKNNFKKKFVKTKNVSNRNNSNNFKQDNSHKINCFRCGRVHELNKCPAFGQSCRKCGILNHFSSQCKVKTGKQGIQQVSRVSNIDDDSTLFIDSIIVGCVNGTWCETIKVENITVNFKIDTGAEANILPLNIIKELSKNINIQKTKVVLEAFGGSKILPIGICSFNCEYGGNNYKQEFFVVNNNTNPILGLRSCELLGIIKRIHTVEDTKSDFIKRNKDIFEGTGVFKEKCTLRVKESAIPVIKAARRIPILLRNRFKLTLDDLVGRKIIEKVHEPMTWVHNLAIVEKKDGSLRLCLDPKELNDALIPELCVIPTIDEINSKLGGKKFFSVLDCKEGFYQIQLDTKSSDLCAFNTVFGCYKFLRLPFGLSVAPQLFQKLNSKNFGNIAGVTVYIDDLLIAGDSLEEHDQILNNVMKRAKLLNVKFNVHKFQFRVSSVKYLGQIYSGDGVRIDKSRIEAIHNLRIPTTKKELQSILGMINFLRNYIPQLAEITNPLRELLRNHVEFVWLASHTNVLNEIKNKLSEAHVLGIYDDKATITVQTDASQNGLGSCLMQNNKPISYASRSLTDCEKRYAQIEKELLAIVYACRKFHFYIYGREVTLQTDHKPLVALFKKDLNMIHSARLQRMRMKLVKYQLNLVHIPGKQMHIADLLSRSFSPSQIEYEDEKDLNEMVHSINISASSKAKFIKATNDDQVLSQLKTIYFNGWPTEKKDIPECLQIFFKFREEIYCEDNLLFFGNRIIVPKALQSEMLSLIHESHQGIVKSKMRATSLLFWPGMTNDIENAVMKCRICERFRDSNRSEYLIPHEVPKRPFQKIAADICEYAGKSYLVVMDYFSKWLEIILLPSKQSSALIKQFKIIFSTHGIPEILISDNMPFGSFEFSVFATNWGFKIITSSPRYAQSNGQAEKGVHIAKRILKKCHENNTDFSVSLMEYRNTPLPGLSISPSEMLMSRRCRTKIPIKDNLLNPTIVQGVHDKMVKKKLISQNYYNRRAHKRKHIDRGENVVYQKNKRWENAKVIGKDHTPRSYYIQTEDNRILRRNSIHLRKSLNSPKFSSNFDVNANDYVTQITNEAPRALQSGSNLPCTPRTTRSGRVIKTPVRFPNL